MIEVILNIGLVHYLILVMLLFLTGLLGVLISRNILRLSLIHI